MNTYLPEITPSPIIEKIKCSYSMEELFYSLKDLPHVSFLNSSLETDIARYSFIAINPFIVITSKGNSVKLQIAKHNLAIKDDPFKTLKAIINNYQVKCTGSFPFIAGGIGYFSYDLKDLLEKLPQKAKNELKLPDLYFAFYQTLLIRDNLDPDNLYLSVLNIKSKKYDRPNILIKKIKKRINSCSLAKNILISKNTRPLFESNFSRSGFINAIHKTLDYIHAGDIYQTCIAQRFKSKLSLPPADLYLKLNKINPAPFSAYLNPGPFSIISSSPELFLRAKDNTVETRPMKGTRPRGKNPKEDKILENELKKSRKEKAELSMIVDLERNDLGKLALPGSVKVAEHRRIEKYSTVFQAISIVKAEMEHNIDLVDIIKSAFPGGSITGCPKIRAMEIIDELEKIKRGIYTGSIGYISFHNTMDLNIAIRTIITKSNLASFHVGSGIVADSNPESEYNETLDKARALMESLE
ncbi:MAG: aminodeoxychorismate synthase component I [Candidatus Omnitrophota bacterium]